ncbi:hypothetical protein CesoFtcFv8_024686 [Champsocephalus esox]|uniref:SET domain-containing protein n=1 Tax=Champsocephalus esox TaxID=159716 RepID=A0AAN8B703_9TELE|nr:hypothetical protein CesoFtcFv8_024686 [Champsocephalus esox]
MHQPVRGNSQGGGTPRTATAVNSAVSQICLVTVTAYSHFIPETSGEVQVKINPLLDMASARPRRAKVKPGEEAAHFSSLCKDKDGFDVKFINSFKGRGVFSCRPFQNGDFLIEYRGEVITKSERENRQKVYHNALKVFMFDFRLNGQEFCVDAAKEDNSLGRLVNDDHWIGVECKICSCFWHKSCYDQDSKMNLKTQQFDFKEPTSAEATSSEEEYYYRLPEATTQLAKISKLLLAMEKGSLKDLQGKTLEEIQIEDNLDLTDIGESEDSEAEEEDPAPHLKTNMGMETARRPVEEPPGTSDDIDSALEGPSKGMETARRPVEEPPGTSDDIHSALEGPSKALNTNADENDKEPGRRGDMHEPPESLETFKR